MRKGQDNVFLQNMAFGDKNLQNAESARRNLSSRPSRCSRDEAIEIMQKSTCSRWGREAGCRGKEKERDEKKIALSTMLIAFSVRKQRAHLFSW